MFSLEWQSNRGSSQMYSTS